MPGWVKSVPLCQQAPHPHGNTLVTDTQGDISFGNRAFIICNKMILDSANLLRSNKYPNEYLIF